ncbi:MAG TPA: hypothetical protein VFM96_07725, partial [Gaiellaceae bacterium]|nr:hypothetical protein [Gaiellaceae bacterium]
MASLPTLSDGIALTHFIVAEDVERAARFYSDVLGGEIVLAGEPTIVALANSWIIINVGGGRPLDRSRGEQALMAAEQKPSDGLEPSTP